MDDHLPTRSIFTPQTPLETDERVVTSFTPDRATYWRENAWLAVIAMAAGMGILWALGNEHVWTGAVGGLFAIGVRSLYLSSDETKMRWDLTDRRLLGPGPRAVALENIAQVNTIFSAVQVVTVAGDKHLLKYQADAQAVKARIDAARGRP
ncbi:hypothetical protein [Roseicyclus mahoneyensis]|uniref:PH (Pleckstrin Homology) domain-containing protein n=1 Tax=Roseicyclus mahoneyensis TaxID=164332 RepID=A0A316GG36_9RHOB|nr:hypothetical protein [Roseicyclus mahoneyensis]PWK59885.1 hypothetical protein C7455_106173 [Roseicyclus mahoneyensis]